MSGNSDEPKQKVFKVNCDINEPIDSDDEVYEEVDDEIDRCSVIAQIDERDAAELLEFAETHSYSMILSYEPDEMMPTTRVEPIADSLDFRGATYALPLFPLFPRSDIIQKDDYDFELLKVMMTNAGTTDIIKMITGAYEPNDYCENKRQLQPEPFDSRHREWIYDLLARDTSQVAGAVHFLIGRRGSLENDYTDMHHYMIHNSFFDSLNQDEIPPMINDPIIFGIEMGRIHGNEIYHSGEENIYKCMNNNWYIYSSRSGSNQPESNAWFNETNTTSRIRNAPALGKMQPHSLQSLCASAVISNLTKDKYDAETCSGLLYLTHENSTLAQLSVRCGPPKTRRLYSFYSIVKNYCINLFTYWGIQTSAYRNCIKENPRPFCSHCFNIENLRTAFYSCRTRGCTVCNILKASLFTNTFESFNGHLNSCTHRVC